MMVNTLIQIVIVIKTFIRIVWLVQLKNWVIIKWTV
jgi:hypothetical protein